MTTTCTCTGECSHVQVHGESVKGNMMYVKCACTCECNITSTFGGCNRPHSRSVHSKSRHMYIYYMYMYMGKM